jgi:hypothetical protein
MKQIKTVEVKTRDGELHNLSTSPCPMQGACYVVPLTGFIVPSVIFTTFSGA